MIKNNIIIFLIVGALLSGCVSKGSEISGTYTNSYKENPSFSKEIVQEVTFYDDGTWFYQKICQSSTNSGVFTIHDNEILATASIGSENFKIQTDGSLIDSKNRTWIKKPK
jgi:hypothetical protein